MKNQKKFYNVLFPFWFLLLLPQLWLIVIPGNFLIDSLVLLISLKFLKCAEKKQFYKKHILKIFLFGMLSDLIGSAFLFITTFVFELGIMGDELYLTIPAVLIAGVMIFVFNYYVTFKALEKNERFKLALIFAIVTAPYTFLIPTSILY